jgi:Family of unknown function (DUF5681)
VLAVSALNDDDAVGHKRPPKGSRWKKGQCGNAGRRRKRNAKSTVEIIDQLLAKPMEVVEHGLARRETGLALIVTQLLKKELAGERRAMTVLNKYEAFALRQNESRDILLKFDSRPEQPRGKTRKTEQRDADEKL